MKDVLNRLLETLHWVAWCLGGGQFAYSVHFALTEITNRQRHIDELINAGIIIAALGIVPPLVRYIAQGRWVWLPWLK